MSEEAAKIDDDLAKLAAAIDRLRGIGWEIVKITASPMEDGVAKDAEASE